MRRSFVRFASAFALLGALVSPVMASKSPTEINTEIDTLLADNKQGLITEAVIRTVLKDIAAAQASLYYLVSTCTANQWVNGFALTGAPTCARPSFSNLSGSISAGQMIAPGVGTLGGVYSSAAGSNQFATGIDTAGAVTYAQPSFSNLSGTIAAAQLIAPGASTFGAVKSSSAPANQFATGIDTSGAVTYAQPSAANVSGLYSYATGGNGTGANATTTGFSAANQALWVSGTLTGSGTGPYSIINITDTAQNLTAGTAVAGLWIAHNINTGALAGNRTSLQPILTKNVALPGTDKNLKFYIPHFSQFYVNSGDGGSAVGPTYYGDHYGGAALVQAGSGATWLETMQGFEIDVSIQAGANSKLKSGILLAGVNSDSQHGDVWEAFLSFTRDGTSTATWNRAIDLFYPQGQWAFSSATTILGSSQAGGAIGYGVDFSNLSISNSAFKSPGFNVAGAGATTVNGLTSTGTVTSTGGSAGLVAGPRGGTGNSYQWYNASGTGLKLYDGTSDILSITSTGAIYAGGEIAPVNTVVGSLGTCNSTTRGALKVVTDGAAGLAWGATQTGGASAVYLSFCNGAAWTVAAK